MTVRQWFHGMVADRDVEQHVRDELASDPVVGRFIGFDISVERGIVVVTGTTYSLAQRHAVEHAIRRVDGVRDVVNDLVVDPPKESCHSDQEIADVVATVLDWTVGVPDGIAVSVLDQCVTLDGTVQSPGERAAAEDAVRRLGGIRDIRNHLVIEPAGADSEIQPAAESAPGRNE